MTSDDLERFQAGSLAFDRILILARHLGACKECARLAESLYGTRAVSAIDDAIENQGSHVDSEHELFAYVDGMLSSSERNRIARHLEGCETCREDVSDLVAVAVAAPRSRVLFWSIAAAITFMSVGLTFYFLRDGPQHDPVVVDRTTVTSERPPIAAVESRPTMAGYGRPDWSEMVDRAISTGTLPMPDSLRALRPPTVRVRDLTAQRAELSPSGTVVETRHPEFTWPDTAGATYVVTIAKGDEILVTSERLSDAHWKASRALPRGETLSWEVEVQASDGGVWILPSPPQPVSLFRILDERGLAELNEARQRFPDDHLLLGVLYARIGIVESAMRELDLHAAENPELPHAKTLASSMRRWYVSGR